MSFTQLECLCDILCHWSDFRLSVMRLCGVQGGVPLLRWCRLLPERERQHGGRPPPAERQHPAWRVQSHAARSSTSRGSRPSGWLSDIIPHQFKVYMSGYFIYLVLSSSSGAEDVSVEKLHGLSGIVPSVCLGRPSHRRLHAGSTSRTILAVDGPAFSVTQTIWFMISPFLSDHSDGTWRFKLQMLHTRCLIS